jgi:rRNA maturation RNase YbeY
MPRNKSLTTESGIFFHQDELAPELPVTSELTSWLEAVLSQEGQRLLAVYYVFVTDDVLLGINQQYLGHDTYTDIITFPYQQNPLEAEIYISVERVRANATAFQVSPREEFLRVIAHGLLHLCGWEDDSDRNKRLMRSREDACLARFGLIPEGYVIFPS